MRVVTAVFLLLAVPLVAQPPRPLPDQAAFVREVRKHVQTDDDRQSGHGYTETRRQRKLDKTGRSKSESVDIVESYPGFPGEPRWERLIEKDGTPVPAAELDKQDRKRQRAAEEYVRTAARQTDADRAKIERERHKKHLEREAIVDDAFRVFEYRMRGREAIDGHDTIAFSMHPRPNPQTRTRIGGMLRHFQGTAWISESDHELVKLEVEVLDDLSIGLGLLARVHKGSKLAFERRKVGGEVWMPLQATYTASARVLLFRSMRVGGTSEFSNYRKFTVDTSTTYETPLPGQ